MSAAVAEPTAGITAAGAPGADVYFQRKERIRKMATYKIKGTRYLRKYTATLKSPVYAASVDAKKAAESMCDLVWERSPEADAQMSYHTEDKDEDGVSGLDKNVLIRDRLDAALFCAEHVGGTHRAYANAACYVFKLPELAAGQSYPRLESCSVQVVSDPYNSAGTRIALHTNATGEIPVACAEVRTGAVYASGVAKRTERTIDGAVYWYPTFEKCELRPEGGMALERYIMVVVALEDYSVVRGNWLEGSSYIDPVIEIVVDGEITGWGDGSDDAVSDAGAAHEFNVARGGEYQSAVGAVSGVYGVEVLQNGDVLSGMPCQFGEVAGDLFVKLWDGQKVVGPDGAGGAAVKFFESVVPVVVGGVNEWRQYVIAAGWRGAGCRGVDLVDLETLKVEPINMSAFTDSDASSAIRFARVSEVSADGATIRVCAYLGNGYVIEGVYQKIAGVWVEKEAVRGSELLNFVDGFGNGGYVKCNGRKLWVPNVTNVGVSTREVVLNISGTDVKCRCVCLPVGNSTGSKLVIVLSGYLYMVNNERCFNVKVFAVDENGAINLAYSLPWADKVTPNVYDDYCVSPIVPALGDGLGVAVEELSYVVTGAFTRLGDVACRGCALVRPDGEVIPLELPGAEDGGKVKAVQYLLGMSDGRYFYSAMEGEFERLYSHSLMSRISSMSEEETCIGLRALYAQMYKGNLVSVSGEGVRHGAGFVVTRDSIAVRTYSDSGDSEVSVPVFRLSISSLAVPFSLPLSYSAKRVRVGWPDWYGASSGGKINVWLRRGAYVESLPGEVLKDPDIYIGGKAVNGWEWLGSIDAVSAWSETSKVFELERPLTDRVATLMFTAFADMDSVNPGRDMSLPHGVATGFSVDAENGSVEGKDMLFRPDITLLG